MKRFLLIAVVLVLVLFAALIGLSIYMRPVIQGDVTATFAHDLSAFVSEHDGNLPKDWSEFCGWMEVHNPKSKWPKEELDERFSILIRKRQEGDKVPRYIEIKDASIRGMEDFVNRMIQATPLEKTNVSIGGSHQRPPP
jgi:hypothetical protein